MTDLESALEKCPLPWRVHDYACIVDKHGDEVVDAASAKTCIQDDGAIMSHIAACVNACQGINPEAVPEMVKALEDIGNVRTHGSFSFAQETARAALAKAKLPDA